MSKKIPSNTAAVALTCLKRAVRDELEKKAMLGQQVIINQDGKPIQISATEALKAIRDKENGR